MMQRQTMGIIGKSLITGIGFVLFIKIGDSLSLLVGLAAPVMPGMSGKVNPTQLFFNQFLSGVLIGLILGSLTMKLRLTYNWRMSIIFFILYGLNSIIIILETIFFTTTVLLGQVFTLLSNAISCASMSVLLTILFRPTNNGLHFMTALREALTRRTWMSNIWRFSLAGFLYLPIFFIFGLLAQPFVQNYYEDPSYGINQLFSIPGVYIIFPLEIIRGFLFVLLAYPLIVILGINMNPYRLSLWIALIIASLSGWLPMLMASFFPLPFRLIHGLEVTFDSIVHSIIIVWLLDSKIQIFNKN